MDIKEKIERLQNKAELLRRDEKKVFIEDIYGTFYFCVISNITSDNLTIIPFKGNHSDREVIKGWYDIAKLDEYKTLEELRDN